MIQIDARLRAIAAFVPAGDVLADIGGDHAYLAAALVQEGRCPRAIVGDLSAGACLAARRTAARCQCIDRIDVRQGDGLSVLLPDEADTVAIAGMGGTLMAQILAAAPHILCTVGTLVLQPMNAADALRRWLYENDWHIADETLVRAGGRLYEVICARQGRAAVPDEALLLIGAKLFAKHDPLLHAHIMTHIARLTRAAEGMGQSAVARQSAAYRAAVSRLAALRTLLALSCAFKCPYA